MRKNIALYIVILLWPLIIFASSNSILDIKSDNIVIDRIQNIMWFNDNVRLEFEEMLLYTSNIEVKFVMGGDVNNSRNKIQSINIPTKLRAVLSNGEGVIIADKAYYDAAKSVVVFTGNVRSEYIGRITITDRLELIATPQF